MGILDRLRTWASKAIAPKAARDEETRIRAEASGGMRRTVIVPQNRDPSPAELRRKGQSDFLRKLLSTHGPAGWVSDHAEEANQCSGWVYVATDARAKRIGGAEYKIYVQDDQIQGEEGRKPVRPDHPLMRLFRRPNPRYDTRGLLYRIEQQLCLTGTALIWAPVNGLGLPAELWVLPTAMARPQPPSEEFPEGSFSVSVISLVQWAFFGASSWGVPAGAPVVIDARHVMRIQYPHPMTEADGLSPVWANGQAIDIARDTDEALWSALQQGPMLGGLISVAPGSNLTPDVADEITAEFEAKFGGARNAGKVMTLQGGTYQKVTQSPSEIVGENLRNQNRDNVLAMDGVPAVATGSTSASAYSGLFAGLLQFDEIQNTPELDMIGGAITLQLAHRYDPRLVIEFKLKPLNDPDLRLRTASQKHQSGCFTVDEIRASYGDGPHPDPAMGKLPAGQAPQPTAPEDPDPNADPPLDDPDGFEDPSRVGVSDIAAMGGRMKSLPPSLWNRSGR